MTSPDKRYQIFISSTFSDLKDERAEVTQAVMELGHIPYGMEAFPAANETQWQWIKRAIEESDYYIVIIGGKYGSINSKTGLSYTEMEYKYAEEIGIPTIAFLVDESIDLPKSKTESDIIKEQKLSDFRKYIESTKLRKSYTSKEDLKAKVITSILQLIRQCPREGWIKASALKDYTSNSEVLKLVKENHSLAKKTEVLAQGNEVLLIDYSIKVVDIQGYTIETVQEKSIRKDWDEIFFIVGNYLFNEPKDRARIQRRLEENFLKDVKVPKIQHKEYERVEAKIGNRIIDKIFIQLEGLGYITTNHLAWGLTAKGRKYYISKVAIKSSTENK